MESFEPLSSTRGIGIDICMDFFVWNSISNNFYSKFFFDEIRIFSETESTSPFLYIIVFQRWVSSELPSSTPGEGDRHVRSFVRNSISNNFYLKLFLMRCVFLAALSPKQNLLFHFEYWYIFVRRPTRARDCGAAFLPSWLDTFVSI